MFPAQITVFLLALNEDDPLRAARGDVKNSSEGGIAISCYTSSLCNPAWQCEDCVSPLDRARVGDIPYL